MNKKNYTSCNHPLYRMSHFSYTTHVCKTPFFKSFKFEYVDFSMRSKKTNLYDYISRNFNFISLNIGVRCNLYINIALLLILFIV